MIKRFYWGLITGCLLVSCTKNGTSISPVREKITESVYASGMVRGKNQHQVFSTVNGIVSRIFVTEGDLIKKDAPILMIRTTTANLSIDNARLAADFATEKANREKLHELELAVNLAKLKMENEASVLERQKILWAQGIGSKNDLDQRVLSLNGAVSAYETAKLRLAELQKQILFQSRQAMNNLAITQKQADEFIIKSDCDGRVYNISKVEGELANLQSPVAVIGEADSFYLELQIDEYDISRVLTGQKIFLYLDSYKGKVFDAVVSKINPLMNERTKTFTVEADFLQKPPVLYPNLSCEANILIRERDAVLTIPLGFLLEGDYVMLANKEKRKVVTGLKDYLKVEIVSGLTVNDVILKPAK